MSISTPKDLLKKHEVLSQDFGPCVEVGLRPQFIEFRRPAGRWIALPYGLMLSAEIADDPRTAGMKSLVLRFRDCEVRVLGDRLEAIFSAVVEQRVARLSTAEPQSASRSPIAPCIQGILLYWKPQ